MGPEVQVEPLMTLARSRDPVDREQLLARLVDLCESHRGELGPRSAREAEAVFFALVKDAERDIRARLAERLARAAWAPPRLIETLARDDIEREGVAAGIDDGLLATGWIGRFGLRRISRDLDRNRAEVIAIQFENETVGVQ